MLAWYLRLARRRPLVAVLALFGGAAVVSVAAGILLGARGSLVPTLLYLLFGAALSWFLGIRLAAAAVDRRYRRSGGWAISIVAMPLIAFALFVSAQAVMVAADLALPFDVVDTRVVAWRYHPSGRGPGSLHLYTADGVEREMPAFSAYAGPRVAGTFRLEITRVERLVVSATPLY